MKARWIWAVAILVMVMAVFLALASGCAATSHRKVSAAEQFVRNKGYRVLNAEGQVGAYVIGTDTLVRLPYIQFWAVQTLDPTPLWGKEAVVEKFTIDHHPLDHFQTGIGKLATTALGRTDVWVLSVDGVPVIGWSFPVTNNRLTGGVYGLNGENWEDVHPGQDFQKWREAWEDRFSPDPTAPAEIFPPVAPRPPMWSRTNPSIYLETAEPKDLSDDRLVAAGKRLLIEYLTWCESDAASELQRLKDFRVESAEFTRSISGDRRLVHVVYSVLPVKKMVLAGNGQEGEDGWIPRESRHMRVVREDGDLKIAGLGTSP